MTRNRMKSIIAMIVISCLVQAGITPLQTVKANTKNAVIKKKVITTKVTLKIVELDKNWKAIGQYSEGLCPVQDKTSGMWGYVDRTGKYIIKPEYYDANPFCEGLAAVKNSSGYYSFIDKTGKVVVSGKITDVRKRFRGEFAGYKGGLAVVAFFPQNTRGNYTLIDKKGNIVKEFDGNTTYVIQMNRFEDKGGIVTNSDRMNSFYDKEYNVLASFNNGYTQDLNGCRCLFNNSSKYLIFDDRGNHDEGSGLYVGAADGSKVFEQSKIPGMDNSYSYRMGISDDYVIIKRNLNGINTSAVYDYNGKVIMDYKYKEIVPVGKDMFIVKNNADIFGIIDKNGKELLPFSLKLNVLSRRADLKSIYEDTVLNFGGVDFIIKDKQSKEKAKYFDFKTKQIKDYIMIKNGYVSLNGFELRCNTDVGVIHLYQSNYSAIIYDSLGVKIGSFEYFFSYGNFGEKISNSKAFISAGIIPVLRKDKSGYTFAIIKK